MCLCPKDQKVKFVLNLLCWGAKDWWEYVTQSFSYEDQVAMTWEQFLEMFRMKYVPLVERMRLEDVYLPLKQMIELVMNISKKFTERALFCPEYVASEHVQVSRYLSMLKTEIQEFISTHSYRSLAEP